MERSQNRTPEAYKKLETASAVVLLFMTVWAPWAFGSTTSLTQGVLSGAGFLAGLLLAGKWWVRRTTGYAPPRWVEPTPLGLKLVRLLAVLTVVFLGYVLIGVLNARAVAEYIASGPTQGESQLPGANPDFVVARKLRQAGFVGCVRPVDEPRLGLLGRARLVSW